MPPLLTSKKVKDKNWSYIINPLMPGGNKKVTHA